GEDGTISVVRKHMRRNNIRFTRFAFEKKGQLFDVNPVKAPNGQHPLKKGLDIDRYGGYNKISGSYFFLVEHRSGKKRIRTLQAVPVLVMNKKENREVISEYLSKERNLEEPRVLIPRILMNSTFEIDGFRLHITGRTNNRIQYTCAEQLILDYDSYDYCKNIYNHTTKSKESRKTLPAEDYGITAEKSILLYDALTEKFRGKKYSAFLGRQSESLASRRDAFLQLTPEEQSEVLNEILHAFQCNPATMNLKKIGGPGNTGMIWPSNDLSKFGSVKLVNQSPSGLFESQKDLMKI
ncbi:MAG: Cas9 endonuclease PAM-interacting domain-containing protein, partial [Gudongella sp.]|nr:Cas9 endonuclease PAM-interacting domain-containing protein [Gudongella sp.]